MKIRTKTKSLILTSGGMFVIAASTILSRFITLNDFAKGSFVGIGIGLLLLGLFIGKFKKAKKNRRI